MMKNRLCVVRSSEFVVGSSRDFRTRTRNSALRTISSMRIAYLDCFSGISGDMFLGALVDAGVSPEVLEKTVAALGVGAKIEVSKVMRSGISATKVDVWVDGEKDMPREEYWAKKDTEHARSHAQHHSHQHGDSGEHRHSTRMRIEGSRRFARSSQ